jgi:hypothetical protein
MSRIAEKSPSFDLFYRKIVFGPLFDLAAPVLSREGPGNRTRILPHAIYKQKRTQKYESPLMPFKNLIYIYLYNICKQISDNRYLFSLKPSACFYLFSLCSELIA